MLSSYELEDKEFMRDYLVAMFLEDGYDEIPEKIEVQVEDALTLEHKYIGNGKYEEIETYQPGFLNINTLDYFSKKEISLWESEKFYQDVIVAEMDDDDVLDYLERETA